MIHGLLDRLLVAVLCIFFCTTLTGINDLNVIVTILALTLSCLDFYINKERFTLVTYFIYCIIGTQHPHFLYFIPLLAYDMYETSYSKVIPLFLVCIVGNWRVIHLQDLFLLCLATAASILLSNKTTKLNSLQKQFRRMKDDNQEKETLLEGKNKLLLEKQDYEIHMATLHERNRIAREIHDNVGHMLSRSILQVGALMTISKDDGQKEILSGLKTTLDTAMNNIRESVHDLYDESIDLKSEMQEVVDQFKFCSIDFQYEVTSSLSRKMKYSILAIQKEALSNIIKHSNATHCRVIFIEHPGLYQLHIEDNGTKKDVNDHTGIGTQNIEDRVTGLNGTLNIRKDKGYRIFIAIPKGKEVDK